MVKIKNKRFLLPFGLTSIIIPFFFQDYLIHYLWFPLLYLFGSFIIFFNFPVLVEYTHNKPLYLEDLTIQETDNNKFRKIYIITMTFLLSILVSGISEYIIINGIRNKPIIELLGIIGGNISIYLNVQNVTGKILLKFFYFLKQREIERRKRSSSDDIVVINI